MQQHLNGRTRGPIAVHPDAVRSPNEIARRSTHGLDTARPSRAWQALGVGLVATGVVVVVVLAAIVVELVRVSP